MVAAWVICWRRCIRLARAGCSCLGELAAPSAASPAAAACASSASAGAVPAGAEGIGHLLPGSRSAGRGAAAAACAPVLATLPGPAAAPWPRRPQRRNRLERRPGATSRRRGGTRTCAGQLGGGRGHACASHDSTAHAGRGGTNGNARADSTDRRAGHRARAELRRTGHEARGDAGAEDAERQQGERGQHHDQRVVDGRLVRVNTELSEQARADADDDGQHQDLDARRHHVAEHLFREE